MYGRQIIDVDVGPQGSTGAEAADTSIFTAVGSESPTMT